MSSLRGIFLCVFLESLVIGTRHFLKFPVAGGCPRAERAVKPQNHAQRAGMKKIPKIAPDFQLHRGALKCRNLRIQDVKPWSGLELKFAIRAGVELRCGLSLLHERNNNPRHGILSNVKNLPLNAGDLQRPWTYTIDLSHRD